MGIQTKPLYWISSFALMIAGILFLQANPITAQGGPTLVGCNQGTSGLFDLFDSSNPFIDQKIGSRVQDDIRPVQTVSNLRALVDPNDPNSGVQDIEIAPGSYRVFAVAADDHFNGHRSGTPDFELPEEDQPFESFYVRINGEYTERPTPDRGLIGNDLFDYDRSLPGPGDTIFDIPTAGYDLEDWNLFDGTNNTSFNNGHFDGDTDYFGRGKYQGSSRSNYFQTMLPAAIVDRDRQNFDIGADLGVIQLDQKATSVSFVHFFADETGNSEGSDVEPFNPNGIKYSRFLAGGINSAHVGIVRLQCITDGGSTAIAQPHVSISQNSVRVGSSIEIPFDACRASIFNRDVVVGLRQFEEGSANFTEVQTQAETANDLSICPSDNDLNDLTLDNSFTFTPTVDQIGQTICFVATVTPGGQNDDDTRVSAQDCVDVTVAALFSVEGGDVISLGGISAFSNGPAVGSFSQYGVRARNEIITDNRNSFGSGNSAGGDELTFANSSNATRGNFGGSEVLHDYHDEFSDLAGGRTPTALNTAGIQNAINDTAAHGNVLPIPVRDDGNASIIGFVQNFNEQVVLVFDGDVMIGQDITIQKQGVSATNPPSIVIIARGNVSIATRVNTIDAVIISNADIDTCVPLNSNCGSPLTINGAVQADGTVHLNRSARSGNSETINYPAYLNDLSFAVGAAGDSSAQITQLRSLPPVVQQ